jgi:hypothetical protein
MLFGRPHSWALNTEKEIWQGMFKKFPCEKLHSKQVRERERERE